MARSLAMLFSLVAYLAFFVTFLWFIAFVGDIRGVAGISPPTTVDSANGTSAPAVAAIANLALIALFGIHHSVAARSGFKDRLKAVVPRSVERSIYVLVATALLAALMWFWQPIPITLWDLRGGVAEAPLWAIFALGWGILLLATFLLNHFELFGLQQAWQHGRPEGVAPAEMRTPLLYKLVRHPLYLGFVIALWATPHLTVGHLLLAGGLTAYILIGIHFEEKDLVSHFGDSYRDYRGRVGSLIPFVGRRAH